MGGRRGGGLRLGDAHRAAQRRVGRGGRAAGGESAILGQLLPAQCPESAGAHEVAFLRGETCEGGRSATLARERATRAGGREARAQNWTTYHGEGDQVRLYRLREHSDGFSDRAEGGRLRARRVH